LTTAIQSASSAGKIAPMKVSSVRLPMLRMSCAAAGVGTQM